MSRRLPRLLSHLMALLLRPCVLTVMTAVTVGAVFALRTAAAESRASAYGSPGQGLAGVGREASREEATSNLAEQGPTLVHRVAEVKHGIESNPPYAGHGTVGHLPALPALQAPPASPPADLWERIRAGFAMEDLEDSLVARWERFYAERPDYVARIVERSSRYLFYIVTEVERRGMPLEIALLPMIESAFNPTALSRAKASGIWQFIPSTGSQFGLRQDWWADSRRDVVAATQGALEYLSKLYAQFGDWHLSLAAYNWGEGSVARAIARAKAAGRDGSYLSLDMPAETRNYVPKLQAVKNIVRDPARYGLTLKPIPNEPYFKTVTLAQPIDIKRAIQLAQVSEEEFLALNPAYHRPVIGGRSEYQILLPAANADLFVANLEADAGPRVSWMAYRTQPGDRLEVLAKRFGTTVAALRAVNGMRNPAPVLPPGYNLLVPSDGPSDEALGSLQNAVFTQFPEYVPPRLHRVRRGETLASVAKRYGVAPATLARWNRLPPRASLRAGRTLYVSGPAPATQTHRFIMSGKRSALPVAEHATKASGKTARAAKQRGKASSLKGKKTAKSSLKSVPASKAKAKLRRR